MSEVVSSEKETKEAKFAKVYSQIESLISNENYLISNLANVCAVLKTEFDFLWVGFYLVEDEKLLLGPFQGPIACTRIEKGRGVCGTCWERKEAIIVADVHKFPGHIACCSLSKSEIVVPLIENDEVFAVLDIDSETLNSFDEIDKVNLEKIVRLIKITR
ncbi:diguanylate cyclase-like protein [Dinothrombium tinctorium]|uniref:Diguanylate cyclase-like protein n=1 Tax=Dinothrombium tinctorium TaxID=1965070 RepID=A0A3S3P7J9_9ACAR|nr:diguanylate cyclase-like protein [Dinothrombium tinctorium]